MKRNPLPFKSRPIVSSSDYQYDDDQHTPAVNTTATIAETTNRAEVIPAVSDTREAVGNVAETANAATLGSEGDAGDNPAAKQGGTKEAKEGKSTMTSNESLKVRLRKKTHTVLDDGIYNAIIKAVSVKTEPDPFRSDIKDATRDRLIISLEVTDDNGTLHDLWYRINFAPDLHPKSNLYKLLDALGKLPADDEDFDLVALVNLPVRAFVKNSVKGETSYSNIEQILPSKVAKAVTTPVPDKAEGEAGDDFDDFDSGDDFF